MNVLLWILQIFCALLFIFAGGTKLVFSAEKLMEMSPPGSIVLPFAFVRFIGVVEVLGALALILPGLTKIRRGLTPLAATGLLIIMIGAVVLTLLGPGFIAAIFPLVVGIFCAVIAYGRRSWR